MAQDGRYVPYLPFPAPLPRRSADPFPSACPRVDIAWVDERGFYYITDRLKELIKVKGFQVPPAELEATLLECPFVADAAVIGVWYEDQATEFPRAYVVISQEGKKQKDPAGAVGEWVDGRVSGHKRLKGGVRVVEVIPKSPSGKLLRRGESWCADVDGRLLTDLLSLQSCARRPRPRRSVRSPCCRLSCRGWRRASLCIDSL